MRVRWALGSLGTHGTVITWMLSICAGVGYIFTNSGYTSFIKPVALWPHRIWNMDIPTTLELFTFEKCSLYRRPTRKRIFHVMTKHNDLNQILTSASLKQIFFISFFLSVTWNPVIPPQSPKRSEKQFSFLSHFLCKKEDSFSCSYWFPDLFFLACILLVVPCGSLASSNLRKLISRRMIKINNE